jgi:hypothetical protein
MKRLLAAAALVSFLLMGAIGWSEDGGGDGDGLCTSEFCPK